jgi:DNA-binding beta-propeller fold protein YncE
MKRLAGLLAIIGLSLLVIGTTQLRVDQRKVGPQPSGNFRVATGQTVVAGTIPYDQRLSDLALNPRGNFAAVVAKDRVFLCDAQGVISGTDTALDAKAGFHGIAWRPSGDRFIVTTDAGHLQEFKIQDSKLVKSQKITLQNGDHKGNPVPGGMCMNRAGTSLYVACADWKGAVEVDLKTYTVTRFIKAGEVPFGCTLSPDEQTLLVSNWGGNTPEKGDTTMASGNTRIKITDQGYASTGSVTLTNLKTNTSKTVVTGLHPTEILCDKNRAYVACAMTDSIDVIDLAGQKRTASWKIKTGNYALIGSMPNALAISGETLYVADGGDNAICEISTKTGKVLGFRPAGFYPTSIDLTPDGKTAFVLNTKGNGSVSQSTKGKKERNTHQFQGTVSVLDLNQNLQVETERVAAFNQWNTTNPKPNLKVYNGGIKHVIYVIKENRTYDEVYGDLPKGNGDPKLCSLGEKVMPNHRKIANEFTLFDNGYTSGTNSADGHQWAVQSMANEYLEHFYVGYSRTYPDDGTDALALNSTDRIWDAALRKRLSVRVYGEWADDDRPVYQPYKPKDWFEAWEDRKSGVNKFKFLPTTDIPALRKILAPGYHYWPLIQSDQSRIDTFEREFQEFVQNGKLPNLVVMSLPCDHGEGTNPEFPTPRAMMADNDLALGRLVDTVSHSKYWQDTAIVVIEDDSQSGPDHVDGHRTSLMIISPYTKRGHVSSEFLTHISLHKTMGLMLGFGPLCKFDAIAAPATDCFTDTPDLTPYTHVPNNVPLDEPNPGRNKKKMTEEEAYWYRQTMALDWSSMDRADPYWLNRINWWSLHHNTEPHSNRPYPSRAGDRPGMMEED